VSFEGLFILLTESWRRKEWFFGKPIPNVQVTDDPSKMLIAHFAGGGERWP
jgi:hypothetical protein